MFHAAKVEYGCAKLQQRRKRKTKCCIFIQFWRKILHIFRLDWVQNEAKNDAKFWAVFCGKILGQNCKDFSCTNFCREKIEFWNEKWRFFVEL